jgi:hypothetical protein
MGYITKVMSWDVNHIMGGNSLSQTTENDYLY